MKNSTFLSVAILLLVLSTVFISCYMGYYQPYPRPIYGPRYQARPMYFRGGGPHYGGPHYGGGAHYHYQGRGRY